MTREVGENQPARLWRGVGRWLLLLPLMFLLIYTCSQTPHLGVGYPVPSVISSNLQATYAPWEYVVVPPISTAIIQDIPELQDNTFEDLTQLQRAERAAAWREVARRMSHEIKNPLTPVQLSAQRLRRR